MLVVGLAVHGFVCFRLVIKGIGPAGPLALPRHGRRAPSRSAGASGSKRGFARRKSNNIMASIYEFEIDAFGFRSINDEIANGVTHAIGLAMSVAGGAVFLWHAHSLGDAWYLASSWIYIVSLVLVYAASTLSHVALEPSWKRFFYVVDQGVIYLLIAGSFTPFALVHLRSGWWPGLWIAMWGGAFVGLISKVVLVHRINCITMWSYLLLGWCPTLAMGPMYEHLGAAGLGWVVLGGLCYTVGTFFLKFDERLPYGHAIWHVLVVVASTCHWWANYHYVMR